jgi:hypothetical protein
MLPPQLEPAGVTCPLGSQLTQAVPFWSAGWDCVGQYLPKVADFPGNAHIVRGAAYSAQFRQKTGAQWPIGRPMGAICFRSVAGPKQGTSSCGALVMMPAQHRGLCWDWRQIKAPPGPLYL